VPTPPAIQVFADEFDGPASSAPDPAKWTYDLGAGGWGNQELETYTNTLQNASMDGAGHLIIRAERNGTTFTSARLKTQGLFAARYGTIESQWVFDNPFFLILNVAVGGSWPGAPDATTQFPQQMIVDYVRVSGS
jgi:beta-glucanase (GH16 family)